MANPIYNTSILPCVTISMKNTQEETKQYLGRRAVTGDISITMNTFAKSDTEAYNLYRFWRFDCDYGSIPFFISLPIFGQETTTAILVKFINNMVFNKEDVNWTNSIELELQNNIAYITDDLGNVLVTDTGEYITTSIEGIFINEVNNYRMVYYGY